MIEQSYQEIELTRIVPNPHNPRKRFSGPKYDEMVASVREKGVISPVLVRPLEDGFELIFRETRFRASCQLAEEAGGLEGRTIPALVRELSDEQAFDFMTIENLQRSDLTELEEARGFRVFAERKGEDALPELAERTGINIRYIRRRVKILSLPREVLEAWEKGELKFGHLEQLVRLDSRERILAYAGGAPATGIPFRRGT